MKKKRVTKPNIKRNNKEQKTKTKKIVIKGGFHKIKRKKNRPNHKKIMNLCCVKINIYVRIKIYLL